MVKKKIFNNETDKNHFHFNQSLRKFHKELFQRKSILKQIISNNIIGEVKNPKEEPKIEEIIGI